MHTPLLLTDDDVRRLGDGELFERDGFASAAEIAAWSAGITASDAAFVRANTGAARRASDARSDRTAWEDDLPGVFVGLRERFIELRDALNEAAWMGLDQFDIQLSTYAPGGHYEPHRDALRGDPARRVTAILYLNPGWSPASGGCLRVHSAQGHRDVAPVGGRLVVFRSELLLHEVRPCQALRHAATAWFRGRSR